MDGPHLIKILEDIGMLILVPFNKRTNELLYSFDYGISGFDTLKFSEEQIIVQSIMKDDHKRFKIYIYGESKDEQYELFGIDMENIVTQKYWEC